MPGGWRLLNGTGVGLGLGARRGKFERRLWTSELGAFARASELFSWYVQREKDTAPSLEFGHVGIWPLAPRFFFPPEAAPASGGAAHVALAKWKPASWEEGDEQRRHGDLVSVGASCLEGTPFGWIEKGNQKEHTHFLVVQILKN